MPIVVTNSGEIQLMQRALDSTASQENLLVKLFKNDYTPVATTDSTDLTVADYDSYADGTMVTGSWGAAATDGTGSAVISYGSNFVFDGTGSTNTVYGYWVEGQTSGDVYWAERLSNAVTVGGGSSFTITPKLVGRSEN